MGDLNQPKDKLWGTTEVLMRADDFSLHSIEFYAGFECSEHYHNFRSNTFVVVKGVLSITVYTDVGIDTYILKEGDALKVQAGLWHKFTAISDGLALEYYFGDDVYGDDDITRRTEGGKIT